MKAKAAPQYRSLSRLVEATEVPSRAVGLFWLGGPSLALKSSAQRVCVVDPVFSDRGEGGPVGATDVRPDLVLCTLGAGAGMDLSTLAHLATAYTDVTFAASEESRDWMIGRVGEAAWDEVPINPARVHTIDPLAPLDVRRLGLRDTLKITVLPDLDEEDESVWNTLFNFGGIHVCLVRAVSGPKGVERLCSAIRRRVDVLIWSLEREDVDGVLEGIARLHPRYAIPIGYDRSAGGSEAARRFREVVSAIRGVKAYLFPEDYLEGLVYSRIMSRRR